MDEWDEWDGSWSTREEWQISRMETALKQLDEYMGQRQAEQDEAWTKYLRQLDRRKRHGSGTKTK